MTASTVRFDQVRYPAIVDPKFDGVRILFDNGVARSRSMLPLPSKFLQRVAQQYREADGFDGEVVVGHPHHKDVFKRSHSFAMTEGDGSESAFVRLHIFDRFNCTLPMAARRSKLFQDVLPLTAMDPRISLFQFVHGARVGKEEELRDYLEQEIRLGGEGIIIRAVDGPYKQGKSTIKEGYLLKMKASEDLEGVIVGFVPLMANNALSFPDQRGLLKKTKRKADREPTESLGAFTVATLLNGQTVEFNVGTGLTDSERVLFWDNRNNLLGKYVKVRYIPVGMGQKPRNPVFLGFRDPLDMDLHHDHTRLRRTVFRR
jgi:DNA ligase 1